jgi:RNA polymerase primary sigma factor
MASKIKSPPKTDNGGARVAEEAEAPPDNSPLLDLSDAAVKKLIRNAKKRGYVTHDQINSVLPSDEVNSEQIEGVLALFNEMGINLIET